MGTERNGKSSRGDFVLDAGALIAFERAEKRMAAFIEGVIEEEEEIVIPTSALAQAWRGGPRSARLARLIGSTFADSLDESRAKEIGERLGSRGKADLADAHVVCCALDREAILITSDMDDMKSLTRAGEHLALVAV